MVCGPGYRTVSISQMNDKNIHTAGTNVGLLKFHKLGNRCVKGIQSEATDVKDFEKLTCQSGPSLLQS